MTIQKICKNCKLYDADGGVCSVTVVHAGNYYELPVLPGDRCLWEQEDVPVQQVRAWSDGRNGFLEVPED